MHMIKGRKIAVFSDIHSNYPAIKACCEDAERAGADGYIFLGDYVSDFAEPTEVLDLVYDLQSRYPCVCLRGNRERYMLECQEGNLCFQPGSKSGSLLYTFEKLRTKDLTFFKKLPIYDCVNINGIMFEVAHATKNDDRFYFDGADSNMLHVISQIEHSYLLTGHSHRQYCRKYGDKTIINPGSIGVAHGVQQQAQYAILSFEENPPKVHLQSIAYDLKSTIHAQFSSGLVKMANFWAISVLYDLISGEEYTMNLLRRVQCMAGGDPAAVYDEKLWRKCAAEMDIVSSEEEIIQYFSGDL